MTWLRVATLSRTGKRQHCRLYNIWVHIQSRCTNPRKNVFAYYGGKGIRRCAEWDDYTKFREWALANGYGKGLSIDRIDGDRGYEPANCRWSTKLEQQRNTKRKKLLTLGGITKPVWAWVGHNGITEPVLRGRIQLGWSDEHALTVPIGGRRPSDVLQRPGRKPRIAH